MAEAALDRLNAAVDALTRALEIDDISALEGAVASLPSTLEIIGVPGALPRDPKTHAQVKALREKLDSARVRIAVLADLGRRRLDTLGMAGIVTGAAATYGRPA